MPKTTIAAIIERKGKILLTRRNIEPFKEMWNPPGGYIESNEKVEDAVKREIKEETGLITNPRFLFYHEEIFPKIKHHNICLVFYSKAKGKVKIDKESIEFRWFSPKEALKLNLAFGHNKTIKKWLKLKS